MGNVRIRLSSASLVEFTATPAWDTEVEIKKEKDQVFYRTRIRKEMVFSKIDYTALLTLDADGCEEVTVKVQRECGGVGVFVDYLTGHFNAGDWRDNRDDCEITVRIDTNDDYECLLRTWKTPINHFKESAVEVKPYDPAVTTYVTTTEQQICVDCPVEVSPSVPGDWCAEPEEVHCSPNDGCAPQIDTDALTTWHRMEGIGTCSGGTPVAPTPDNYWTLLTDNCPTDSVWWRCPGGVTNDTLSRMAQGRNFVDIVIATFLPCGLTVASDFFDINPDTTAPSNDAYDFAALYLQEMSVHQKSDVKRPWATNPATSNQWNISPKELLDDLRILFNVFFTIEGTTIRIEHQSYFDTVGGLDASGDPQRDDIERDREDDIKREDFFLVDEVGASPYFLGAPIIYDCGVEGKDNRCQVFNTDVVYVQTTDSEGIEDENFVLCSTETIASVRYLIRDNRALSFTELHNNLHRHFRFWKQGLLNGFLETFITFRPTQKQPAFDHALCCDDVFLPREPVTTVVGTGALETGIYTIQEDIIQLEIKH